MAKRDVRLESIKSMFVAGQVRQMKDMASVFPTLVSQSLGMNYQRYLTKLENPKTFTIHELHRLSLLLGIDIHLLFNIIIQQMNTHSKKEFSEISKIKM